MGLAGLVALILLATSASAMNQFGSEVGLTYGSVIRIISPITGYMYATLNAEFIPMTSSSEEAA
jgi:hypothetical protein